MYMRGGLRQRGRHPGRQRRDRRLRGAAEQGRTNKHNYINPVLIIMIIINIITIIITSIIIIIIFDIIIVLLSLIFLLLMLLLLLLLYNCVYVGVTRLNIENMTVEIRQRLRVEIIYGGPRRTSRRALPLLLLSLL